MEQHVRADFFLWIFWFPSSTLYFVQFYATVQRQKNPGLTPFSSGYEVDTIEQLKRAVRSQVIIDWFCTPTPVLYNFTQTSGLR